MTHFRIRFAKLGGHVHASVFSGLPGGTFAKNGDLTFSVEEWPEFMSMFANGRVEFIDESV